MAVPFRRTSKTAKALRRTHFKLKANGLVACPHCGALIRAHHVCPKCGFYAGKEVIHVKQAAEQAPKKTAK